jgi:membrane protein
VVAVAAIAAALLFSVGKYLVGLYLARASVVSTYGAAGSLVVLIIWVFYTSQVLLIGVAFGRQFEVPVRAGPVAPPPEHVDTARSGST